MEDPPPPIEKDTLIFLEKCPVWIRLKMGLIPDKQDLSTTEKDVLNIT